MFHSKNSKLTQRILILYSLPVSNNQEVNIMTLMELQKILGERIRIASDNTLSVDERRKETELSQTISSLAKQMINNADVVLRTDKLVAEGKLKESHIERLVHGHA